MPRGCFAELEAPEDEIATMARRAEAGRLDWRDAEGNALSIPLSLRGLAPALAALRGA
jgi:invasion protein IalB